jgi:hypothetical protein
MYAATAGRERHLKRKNAGFVGYWVALVSATWGVLLGLLAFSGYNDDAPSPWYVGPGFLLAGISGLLLAALLLFGIVWVLTRLGGGKR